MKKILTLAVAAAFSLLAQCSNASTIFASSFDRIIYDSPQCYLETYAGTTNLGDPDIFSNLLGESDSVELGWRNPTPANGFVVSFDTFLMDGDGDDLIVRDFGPGTYSIYVSNKDIDSEYVKIGDSTDGTPGEFNEYGFDFNGIDNVKYVKILRTGFGAGNGRFFDSFQGLNAVPEPCTIGLLGLGSLCLLRKKN